MHAARSRAPERDGRAARHSPSASAGTSRPSSLLTTALAKDLEAALNLAQDLMEYERRPEIDASLIANYGQVMRQTATAVRQSGRSAVAHPALLARAIVLARTLDRTAAGRRTPNGDRVLQPA